MHGRNLFDGSDERSQHLLQSRRGDVGLAVGLDNPFRIASGTYEAQSDCCFVVLVGIQQCVGKLGCLAQADGQEAGCKRIQSAGMAGLRPGE